jgi:hypothetical protein
MQSLFSKNHFFSTSLLKKSIEKTSRTYLTIFLFTILSGVLRKWVFTSYAVGNIIFFFQLLVPYLLFTNENFKYNKVLTNRLIIFFLIYIIAGAFNPLQKTALHGGVGILLHFSFWFLAFYYIENREFFDARKWIFVLVVVAFSEVVLGFIQYGLPQRHFLNRYAAEQNVGNIIAEVGTAVRITGTFSYITGFSSYLLFHALFVWGLIIYQYRPAVTLSLMLGGLVACFMNGSRGATYVYILIMVFFLIFEARKTNISSFILRLIVPFMVVYLVVLARGQLGLETTVSTAFDNFQARRESLAESGEEKNRLFWDYYALRDFRGQYPIFGIGIGATYQGAIVLWGMSEALIEYGYIESEMERYVVEGGFILLFIRLLLTYYFCISLSVPWQTKWLIGGLTFIAPITFNIFNIVFFMTGIIFLDQAYYHKRLGMTL